MTYNVFGGTLNLALSIYHNCSVPYRVLQLCTVISTRMRAVLTGEQRPVGSALGFRVYMLDVLFLN